VATGYSGSRRRCVMLLSADVASAGPVGLVRAALCLRWCGCCSQPGWLLLAGRMRRAAGRLVRHVEGLLTDVHRCVGASGSSRKHVGRCYAATIAAWSQRALPRRRWGLGRACESSFPSPSLVRVCILSESQQSVYANSTVASRGQPATCCRLLWNLELGTWNYRACGTAYRTLCLANRTVKRRTHKTLQSRASARPSKVAPEGPKAPVLPFWSCTAASTSPTLRLCQ
jgi:hypothetical protein